MADSQDNKATKKKETPKKKVAKKSIKKMKSERMTERMLKVEFSSKDRVDLSITLARHLEERDQKQLERNEVKKSFDAEVAALDAIIAKVAGKVRDGYEYKGIPVKIELNYHNNTKKLIRMDTKKVIEEGPIPEDETQTNFLHLKDEGKDK